jgi:hypothetical protein
MPPAYFRDDGGGARYYVYVWWHGRVPIYVGKGTSERWTFFYLGRNYNSHEAHDYVKRHARELPNP